MIYEVAVPGIPVIRGGESATLSWGNDNCGRSSVAPGRVSLSRWRVSDRVSGPGPLGSPLLGERPWPLLGIV